MDIFPPQVFNTSGCICNMSPTEYFSYNWIKIDFPQSPRFNLNAFKWKDKISYIGDIMPVEFYIPEKMFYLEL